MSSATSIDIYCMSVKTQEIPTLLGPIAVVEFVRGEKISYDVHSGNPILERWVSG